MIDTTSVISNGAKVGSDVKIGRYVKIGSNVTLKNGVSIDDFSIIDGHTTIGEHTKILSHSVLGTPPQHMIFKADDCELIIGKNNTIREHTLINVGTKDGGGKTVIGDSNLIMGHVHIGHDVIMKNNIVITNSSVIGGHSCIDDNVIIGGLSAIHQFSQIGKMAMIGGGSIVVNDIPPYMLCEGNRAAIRSLNIVGLRRNFKNSKDIDILKKCFKALFLKKGILKQKAQELINNNEIYSNGFAKELIDFILKSKRGISFKSKEI